MRVLVKEGGVERREQDNRNTYSKGKVDPSPHFGNFFFDRVRMKLGELFLVLNASTDLLDGFGLHGGFAVQFGDHDNRATLSGSPYGGHTTAGNATSDTERLKKTPDSTNNDRK